MAIDTSVGAFAPAGGASGVVVARRSLGEVAPGHELVGYTVETRQNSDAAFGPAVELAVGADAGAQAKDLLELSAEERAIVDALRMRDAQVRQEEEAHAAAAGDLAGAIQYHYVTGPDGRRYVAGGEVPIRAGDAGGDPSKARSDAARLATAANAATNPSAADLAAARRGYHLLAESAEASHAETSRVGVRASIEA